MHRAHCVALDRAWNAKSIPSHKRRATGLTRASGKMLSHSVCPLRRVNNQASYRFRPQLWILRGDLPAIRATCAHAALVAQELAKGCCASVSLGVKKSKDPGPHRAQSVGPIMKDVSTFEHYVRFVRPIRIESDRRSCSKGTTRLPLQGRSSLVVRVFDSAQFSAGAHCNGIPCVSRILDITRDRCASGNQQQSVGSNIACAD